MRIWTYDIGSDTNSFSYLSTSLLATTRIDRRTRMRLIGWMDGWMGGWMEANEDQQELVGVVPFRCSFSLVLCTDTSTSLLYSASAGH